MLARIHCRFFRNLETTDWQPGAGCHLVLGANGAGKSSLLEAVYLLATTRSFRTVQLLDCARQGGSEFHLEGEVQSERRTRLALGTSHTSGRYRSINGSATNLIEHLKVLPVVAWTSDDREILSGPPERRRRFVDQGIVGSRPTALEVLARFRRTLLQKRRLLLSDTKGLDSWNQLLAESACELMRLRQEYLDRLTTALAEVVAALDLDLQDLELEYRPSLRIDEPDAAGILVELERVRDAERRERRPLVGPHRDEVSIRLGGQSLRQVGSAGERKVIGLLLTAARGRVLVAAKRAPIYLLDDADSELDRDRLEAIWRAFEGVDQVLVTSSRPEVWAMAPEAIRWHLEAGRLRSGSDSRERV